MDIEQRLERLAERTDALTQSLELMAALHRDSDKRMDRLAEMFGRLEGFTIQLAERNMALERYVERIAESTAALVMAARDHEGRIGNLEGNQAQ